MINLAKCFLRTCKEITPRFVILSEAKNLLLTAELFFYNS